MKRGPIASRLARWLLAASLAMTSLSLARAAAPAFPFRTNDVIAFVGGEDSVEMHRLGYVELLLSRALPAHRLRFRGLGWEGDTVDEQPRELNFPKWPEQLKRSGATVVVCQFGQAEALRGPQRIEAFIDAYGRLLDTLSATVPRVILVSSTRFEPSTGLLPDLTQHLGTLAIQTRKVRELAARRGLTFIDLFNPETEAAAAPGAARRTRDGWHLNPAGHWEAAQSIVTQLGYAGGIPSGASPDRDGRLTGADLEPLHRAILGKTQLWFHYWRPENWAFLNGDRTEQPSSRDHRDPKVRWFPAEMEQFVPLIEAREREIAELAQRSSKIR